MASRYLNDHLYQVCYFVELQPQPLLLLLSYYFPDVKLLISHIHECKDIYIKKRLKKKSGAFVYLNIFRSKLKIGFPSIQFSVGNSQAPQVRLWIRRKLEYLERMLADMHMNPETPEAPSSQRDLTVRWQSEPVSAHTCCPELSLQFYSFPLFIKHLLISILCWSTLQATVRKICNYTIGWCEKMMLQTSVEYVQSVEVLDKCEGWEQACVSGPKSPDVQGQSRLMWCQG